VNGGRKRSKPGRPIESRPLKPFDCFKPVFPPPENDPHYGVVVFIYKTVAIVAVGTTKHKDEPTFVEVDGEDCDAYGLTETTRFLDRFVHAHWYRGASVNVYGQVPVPHQIAFKRAAERALLAHARGTKIPTMPDRTEIAALKNPTVADDFFIDLHNLAGQTAATKSPEAPAAHVPPAVPSAEPPPDDDGDG
jgi:hypothetical protein